MVLPCDYFRLFFDGFGRSGPYSSNIHPHLTCTKTTAFAATPSGALLVLIPQPERKWVLKQLSDWGTPVPKEQTIAIGEAAGRAEVAWYTGDLTVTRDGNYALIRIASFRRKSDPTLTPAAMRKPR
jgi:hypothetical protein